MANKLEELKNALGPGARANKYRVNFAIPAAVPNQSNLAHVDILCRSTSFPSMTVGQIEVFNQGRKLVIPGDTTYTNTWTLTIYATEDHALRRDLIAWMKACDHFQNNEHSGNPSAVLGELSVEQLDSKGNPTVRYTFYNVFPTEIGEISLTDDTDAGVIEFDVTFSFTDWVVGTKRTNEPFEFSQPARNDIAS